MRRHAEGILPVCFSPDREKLLSGSRDNTIIMWDVTTTDKILKGYKDHVVPICFSPDGKRLASGSLDEVIRIRPV